MFLAKFALTIRITRSLISSYLINTVNILNELFVYFQFTMKFKQTLQTTEPDLTVHNIESRTTNKTGIFSLVSLNKIILTLYRDIYIYLD